MQKNPSRGKIFFSSPRMSSLAHGPTQSPSQCVPVKGTEGVKLTTCLLLVPRLTMSRAIPLVPLFAFVVRTGTRLPLWGVMFEPSEHQEHEFIVHLCKMCIIERLT